MKTKRLDTKSIIKNIDFNAIKDHPNILIAAGFWEEERFDAAKICYKFMRKIDDLIDDRKALGTIENDERENLRKNVLGGIIRVELDNTHSLAYGYEDHYYTLKNSNKAYKFLQDGWNIGYIDSPEKAIAGYIGSEVKDQLNKNLTFGVEHRGRGRVVYFADDPIFRGFWQNGKLFMVNAVFFDN